MLRILRTAVAFFSRRFGTLDTGSQLSSLVAKADEANRLRNWAVAEEYYAKALELMPADDGLRVQYGHSLKEQGNLREAEQAYRAAIDLNSKCADTFLQLGHVLKLQERRLEAVESYQHALTLDPDFLPAIDELQRPEARIILAQTNTFDSVADALIPHFDAQYYGHKNPDVIQAGLDGLHHYCAIGWREHRDPAPWFKTSFYLNTYDDVRASGLNPFFHYLMYGEAEGRHPANKGDEKLALLASLRDKQRPDLPELNAVSNDRGSLIEAMEVSIRDNKNGTIVSLSHTSYIDTVAGTELFLGKEQIRFNDAGYSYIHLSPMESSDYIYETAVQQSFLKLVLDGRFVGVFSADVIVSVLGDNRRLLGNYRSFVVHSLLGHSIETVMNIHDVLNADQSFFWLHDYSSLCSGYNLIRNHVEFCGAPPVGSLACRICIFGNERLRRVEQMKRLFSHIPFIVLSPSLAALEIWERSFESNGVASEVVPHSTLELGPNYAVQRSDTAPVKVAFVGYPVEHKGWRVFAGIVNASRFNSRIKFFHFVSDGFAHDGNKYIQRVHAEVKADSQKTMVDLLVENEIDIVVMPSIWPETFSFVTYEAIAAGCTVLALRDSGNVAAVVEKLGVGVVFENQNELMKYVKDNDRLRSSLTPSRQLYTLVFNGSTAASTYFEGNRHNV